MIRRRRCQWCQVKLRWWQLYHCRLCNLTHVLGAPGPPCPLGWRYDQSPDKFRFSRWME